MSNSILKKSIDIAGRQLSLETGKLAKQANGAALVKYGDTVVLATATASAKPREGIDFFPLTVDYEERLYAVGKIPGGFIKREGRPSEKAILSSRLIDRPIRPLFPKGFRNDVQVVTTVMSVDQDNPPDITAMIGGSAALTLSDIPFQMPIAGVIVGRINGEFIINPTIAQKNQSELHLVISGTKDAVMMVEASADEIPEEIILEAILFGHEEVKKIIAFIENFREEAFALKLAKEKTIFETQDDPEIEADVRSFAEAKYWQAAVDCAETRMEKKKREKFYDALKEEAVLNFAEKYPDNLKIVKKTLDKLEKETVRRLVTKEKIRIDGRKLDEVRHITTELGILPRTHGSGLFTRGQTQVLTVTTLGSVSEEQMLDGLGLEDSKRYMHHYNFPSFSVGEARPMRGPGRREIGHGALAEKALEPVIPSEVDFPYTIRLVSEVLESNGSSSMASVCGSCLSLMDAGVPIRAMVAGVAMGLIKEGEDVAVLTDIQGAEDHLGDMDFKVAGTEAGVTAIQMDIKIAGIDRNVLQHALTEAKKGRMFILNKMRETISEPKNDLSPFAPRMISINIHPDKIREVIGPGGKIIKKIIDETGVKIDIEDDGRVFIGAIDGEAAQKALQIIQTITQDVETGKNYLGKVTKVTDFGAFVEIIPGVLGLPGKEGMVHISQLSEQRVNKVEDVVKEGEEILVKSLGNDPQGRLRLSRKDVLRDQRLKEEQNSKPE